jgi:hypothetical protein
MGKAELRNRLYQCNIYGSSVIWEYAQWSAGEPVHDDEKAICKITFDIPETTPEVQYCHVELEIMPRPDISNPIGDQLNKKRNEIVDEPGRQNHEPRIVAPINDANGRILLVGMGGEYDSDDGHTQWVLLYFDVPATTDDPGEPPEIGTSERVPHIVQLYHSIRADEGFGHWNSDGTETESKRREAFLNLAVTVKEPPGRFGEDVGAYTLDIIKVEQGTTGGGQPQLFLRMQNVDIDDFIFNVDHLLVRNKETDERVSAASVIWNGDPNSTDRIITIPADVPDDPNNPRDPNEPVGVSGEFVFDTRYDNGEYIYQHEGETWYDVIIEQGDGGIEAPNSRPRINPGG